MEVICEYAYVLDHSSGVTDCRCLPNRSETKWHEAAAIFFALSFVRHEAIRAHLSCASPHMTGTEVIHLAVSLKTGLGPKVHGLSLHRTSPRGGCRVIGLVPVGNTLKCKGWSLSQPSLGCHLLSCLAHSFVQKDSPDSSGKKIETVQWQRIWNYLGSTTALWDL